MNQYFNLKYFAKIRRMSPQKFHQDQILTCKTANEATIYQNDEPKILGFPVMYLEDTLLLLHRELSCRLIHYPIFVDLSFLKWGVLRVVIIQKETMFIQR